MLTAFLRQLWHVSAVHFNMIALGMGMGYPSSLLPALRAPDSPIKLDLNAASWISSCIGFSSIPGYIVSSWLMHAWGRRVTCLIMQVPGVLGLLCIYFANDFYLLLLGRLLGGFTGGGNVSLGSVVIGEFSSPQNRGMFLNLKTASLCTGSAIVHALGHFYHWRTLALMCTAPYIISFAIICTWVESPAWLASKKKFNKSKDAFLFLRGDSDHSRREISDLIKTQRNQTEQKKKKVCRLVLDFFKKFGRKDFYKPIFILTVGFILLEFSGRHIFPAYAADIINQIAGNKEEAFYYNLIIDIIIALSATISSIVVKLMRRRLVLFTTGFASVIVVLLLCVYLYLSAEGIISKERSWVPITIFVLYFILVNQGSAPIPMALLGELLPLEHRSVGSSVSGITIALLLQFGLSVTPYLMQSVKVYGTFAVFAAMSSVCLTILYFVLPETKDRTLLEIENYFKTGRFDDIDEDDVETKKMILTETKQ
ncbi:facilitated trehalose transporter Tret1-2 homolog [Ostrinia nubilalis]|uniref:facilitated trehalose transporter Tret1-2 homolog n=1 Tax=Ostrinia nubilalis TaxID=29057 RepID=UPI0030825F58